MSGINRLNEGEFSTASQIPFFDGGSGVDRRGSVSNLKTALGVLDTAPLVTQYAAPNATGFTVSLSPPEDGQSLYLLLTPSAGFAAGTIVLPLAIECRDGQEVLVSSTQAVTALTITGNGAAVNGAPTTLAANSFFRLRFDGVFKAWYRIG